MSKCVARAASGAFAAANGTGSFFSLTGVNGKTVLIHRLFTSIELFRAEEPEDYIVLRDASEGIEVYLESAPGGVVTMMIRAEWLEE